MEDFGELQLSFGATRPGGRRVRQAGNEGRSAYRRPASSLSSSSSSSSLSLPSARPPHLANVANVVDGEARSTLQGLPWSVQFDDKGTVASAASQAKPPGVPFPDATVPVVSATDPLPKAAVPFPKADFRRDAARRFLEGGDEGAGGAFELAPVPVRSPRSSAPSLAQPLVRAPGQALATPDRGDAESLEAVANVDGFGMARGPEQGLAEGLAEGRVGSGALVDGAAGVDTAAAAILEVEARLVERDAVAAGEFQAAGGSKGVEGSAQGSDGPEDKDMLGVF